MFWKANSLPSDMMKAPVVVIGASLFFSVALIPVGFMP
nr:MAG TPA: hypothetical protein [Caudoviricetes sp.]